MLERAYWKRVRSRAWRDTNTTLQTHPIVVLSSIVGWMVFLMAVWFFRDWHQMIDEAVMAALGVTGLAAAWLFVFVYSYNAAPAELLREAELQIAALSTRVTRRSEQQGLVSDLHALVEKGLLVTQAIANDVPADACRCWADAWREALRDFLRERDMEEQFALIDHVPAFQGRRMFEKDGRRLSFFHQQIYRPMDYRVRKAAELLRELRPIEGA